jgi:hypothetical protein
MGMDPKAKRTALATALRAGLPAGWTVYAAPPDNLVQQAAVVSPRSPYVTRVAGGVYETNLQVTLLVNVATGIYALDILDDAIKALEDDVLAGPYIWDSVSEMGVVEEPGGAEYIAATINITAI